MGLLDYMKEVVDSTFQLPSSSSSKWLGMSARLELQESLGLQGLTTLGFFSRGLKVQQWLSKGNSNFRFVPVYDPRSQFKKRGKNVRGYRAEKWGQDQESISPIQEMAMYKRLAKQGVWGQSWRTMYDFKYGIAYGHNYIALDLASTSQSEFMLFQTRSSWWSHLKLHCFAFQRHAKEGNAKEHLLNDQEVELLKVLDVAHIVKVMQWPSALLSNELRIALGVAQNWQGKDDKELWGKISKHEYRRCAVLECYDSVKFFLLTILRDGSKEHSIVAHVFKKIEMDIELGVLAQNLKLNGLSEVHSLVLTLVELLLLKPDSSNVHTVVNAIQNLYDVVIRDFCTQNQQQYSGENGTGSNAVYNELLFCDAVKLPSKDDDAFFARLRRLHTILST
ncbi:hypothetical protein L7F22_006684 [Adiantum nelumboides]|nr:hypothetical protein [Adiantum nelumboides]